VALHHFVPVFVLKRFASPDAWKLVRASGSKKRELKRHDSLLLSKSNPRNWPLCVLDKSDGTIVRRKLNKVCSRTNFYSLPDYSDPIMRGIVRHNIRSFESDPSKFQPFTDEELIDLGQKPLDLDEIERVQISTIDGKFAGLIEAIEESSQLSEADQKVLLRFIALARYRGPIWREIYYPEIYKRTQTQLIERRKNLESMGWVQPSLEEEKQFDTGLERSLYQMAIVQACAQDHIVLAQAGAKITILHATGSYRFITCDNLARPYYPSKLVDLPRQRLPGIGEPNTRSHYPISPNTCIEISTDSKLPRYSHREIKGTVIKEINSALALMAMNEIIIPKPSKFFFQPWIDISAIPKMQWP
jgi:hypothetical protein